MDKYYFTKRLNAYFNEYYKYIPPEDPILIQLSNLYYELMYARLMILFKIYNKENYLTYPDKNNK